MTSHPADSASIIMRITAIICGAVVLSMPLAAFAQDSPKGTEAPTSAGKAQAGKPPQKKPKDNAPPAKKKLPAEGTMTISRMDEIIRRLDPKTKAPRPGSWQFKISKRPVAIITDAKNNRMRIMSPVIKVESLPDGVMQRMMQANFDTALDAR